MTIKEIKKELAGQYVDVLVYVANEGNKYMQIHTDFMYDVENLQISEDDIDNADIEECVYELMDEDEFNSTVLANTIMSFDDMYEKGDKVLVIVLSNRYAHWLRISLKEKIEEFKETNNCSNKDIANLIGVPLRTLENWKAGSRCPDTFKERLISEILWRDLMIK